MTFASESVNNGVSVNLSPQAIVSRQVTSVSRQAERENNARVSPMWDLWGQWARTTISGHKKWSPLLPYLRSVIPHDATISANSKIKSPGKAVGHKNADGTWGGDLDWTKLRADEKYAKRAAHDGASVGLQTVIATVVDIDVSNPQLADAIQQLCFDRFGVTDVRGRANSAKRALFYMYAAGEEPVNKVKLYFIDPLEKTETKTVHLVEISGANNMIVLDGIHKSGVPYEWTRRPCDHLDDIPRIGQDQIQGFTQRDLHEFLDLHSLQIVVGGHGSGNRPATRKKLPCPELAGR